MTQSFQLDISIFVVHKKNNLIRKPKATELFIIGFAYTGTLLAAVNLLVHHKIFHVEAEIRSRIEHLQSVRVPLVHGVLTRSDTKRSVFN